jgi:hypothetical protein
MVRILVATEPEMYIDTGEHVLVTHADASRP